MTIDGLFIGEKTPRSGSGSELRGTHPIRVGFGGLQMVTAHRFSGRSWEEMVVLGPSLQETCVATVTGSEKRGSDRPPPIRSDEATCFLLVSLKYFSVPNRCDVCAFDFCFFPALVPSDPDRLVAFSLFALCVA